MYKRKLNDGTLVAIKHFKLLNILAKQQLSSSHVNMCPAPGNKTLLILCKYDSPVLEDLETFFLYILYILGGKLKVKRRNIEATAASQINLL